MAPPSLQSCRHRDLAHNRCQRLRSTLSEEVGLTLSARADWARPPVDSFLHRQIDRGTFGQVADLLGYVQLKSQRLNSRNCAARLPLQILALLCPERGQNVQHLVKSNR